MHTAMQSRSLRTVALGLILWALAIGMGPGRAQAVAVTPTATATPVSVRVLASANLRSGPGTGYAVVGAAKVGASLPLMATNATKDWFQLATGAWVYGTLLASRPVQLPVALVILTPLPTRSVATPKPKAATTIQIAATPAPTDVPVRASSACAGGCTAQPDPSCDIKGNVNSHGERIYHTTSSRSYNVTKVKLEEGDRWFCTEAEAEAAGFRAPRN